MLSIYHNEPTDWKDLQIRVAKIFSDRGFTSLIEKEIKLVRGTTNVDILATLKHQKTQEIHIVECKHWTHKVKKSTVHSFRTIVSDYGANTGYIIFSKGFQKGAFEAAENTNLHLLSFDQFQTEFRTRWLENVVDELEQLGYPPRKYSDPMESFYDKEVRLLGEAKQNEFSELQHKYESVSLKSFRMMYRNMILVN